MFQTSLAQALMLSQWGLYLSGYWGIGQGKRDKRSIRGVDLEKMGIKWNEGWQKEKYAKSLYRWIWGNV